MKAFSRSNFFKISLFILLVFYCLSFGLDLFYDGYKGGTSGDAPYKKRYDSLRDAQAKNPQAYTPVDFIKTFNVQKAQQLGNYGDGETIAFLETSNYFDQKSFKQFCNTFSNNFPQLNNSIRPIVITNNNKNDPQKVNAETMLDVEWAHVIAPKAKLVIIDISNVNEAQLRTALIDNHITSISISSTFIDFAKRNVLIDGIFSLFPGHSLDRICTLKWMSTNYPVFVASGDGGPRITPVVAAPNTVIVGGIEEDRYLSPHELSSFKIWDQEGQGSAILDAFAAPYQLLNNNRRPIWRQVPDVTWLAGYPGVFISSNQDWDVIGGTSLASPCWAALWALANAAHKKETGIPLSPDANQILYETAKTFPDSFYKINDKSGQWSDGWGLGFPNAGQLVSHLSDFQNFMLQPHYSLSFQMMYTILFFLPPLISLVLLGFHYVFTHRKEGFKKDTNLLKASKIIVIMWLFLILYSIVTNLIVMQIPTFRDKVFAPIGEFNAQNVIVSIIYFLESRYFAFLVIGTMTVRLLNLHLKHLLKKFSEHANKYSDHAHDRPEKVRMVQQK